MGKVCHGKGEREGGRERVTLYSYTSGGHKYE